MGARVGPHAGELEKHRTAPLRQSAERRARALASRRAEAEQRMMGAHREALEQARLADGHVANEHKLEDVIVLLRAKNKNGVSGKIPRREQRPQARQNPKMQAARSFLFSRQSLFLRLCAVLFLPAPCCADGLAFRVLPLACGRREGRARQRWARPRMEKGAPASHKGWKCCACALSAQKLAKEGSFASIVSAQLCGRRGANSLL